jgi:hypothetical protein
MHSHAQSMNRSPYFCQYIVRRVALPFQAALAAKQAEEADQAQAVRTLEAATSSAARRGARLLACPWRGCGDRDLMQGLKFPIAAPSSEAIHRESTAAGTCLELMPAAKAPLPSERLLCSTSPKPAAAAAATRNHVFAAVLAVLQQSAAHLGRPLAPLPLVQCWLELREQGVAGAWWPGNRTVTLAVQTAHAPCGRRGTRGCHAERAAAQRGRAPSCS